MPLDLTLAEIIHLAHCAGKMTALAEKSHVIADTLGIDPTGRAKLARITQKITGQVEKYIHQTPANT